MEVLAALHRGVLLLGANALADYSQGEVARSPEQGPLEEDAQQGADHSEASEKVLRSEVVGAEVCHSGNRQEEDLRTALVRTATEQTNVDSKLGGQVESEVVKRGHALGRQRSRLAVLNVGQVEQALGRSRRQCSQSRLRRLECAQSRPRRLEE